MTAGNLLTSSVSTTFQQRPSTMQLPSFYMNSLDVDMGKTIIYVKAYCRHGSKAICILHLDTKMGASYQPQASVRMQCIRKDP